MSLSWSGAGQILLASAPNATVPATEAGNTSWKLSSGSPRRCANATNTPEAMPRTTPTNVPQAFALRKNRPSRKIPRMGPTRNPNARCPRSRMLPPMIMKPERISCPGLRSKLTE